MKHPFMFNHNCNDNFSSNHQHIYVKSEQVKKKGGSGREEGEKDRAMD
jgi:hypothetical protein